MSTVESTGHVTLFLYSTNKIFIVIKFPQYSVAIKGLNVPLNISIIVFHFYGVNTLYLHGIDHGNAFLKKLFVILFKPSTISRIFHDTGSPGSPLYLGVSSEDI